MNNLNIICLIIICLNFSSCGKEELDEYYSGNVSVLKNNNSWVTKIRTTPNKPYMIGISILIVGFKSNNYLTDQLYFYKMPFKVGYYPISHTDKRDYDGLIGANYLTIMDGGGVLGAFYDLELNDSIPDYIEITNINGLEITGKFSLSFKLKNRNGDLTAPEFVTFTNGTFSTRLL